LIPQKVQTLVSPGLACWHLCELHRLKSSWANHIESDAVPSYFDLARMYHEWGKNNWARNRFEKALELYEELKDREQIAAAYSQIGDIYYENETYV